jgi:hypothetical protein
MERPLLKLQSCSFHNSEARGVSRLIRLEGEILMKRNIPSWFTNAFHLAATWPL